MLMLICTQDVCTLLTLNLYRPTCYLAYMFITGSYFHEDIFTRMYVSESSSVPNERPQRVDFVPLKP